MWYDNGASGNPFDSPSVSDAGWLIFRADLRRVAEAAQPHLMPYCGTPNESASNTGADDLGNAIPNGALEPDYFLHAAPSGVPLNPLYRDSGPTFYCNADDAPGTPGSTWLLDAANGGPGTGTSQQGLYIYRR